MIFMMKLLPLWILCASSSCDEESADNLCSVVNVERHSVSKHSAVAMLQKGHEIAMQRQASNKRSAPFEPWKDDPSEIEASQSLLQAHGDAAALDEDGYKSVAKLRNPEEMAIFVKRAAKSLGLLVVDEEALNRMLPKYDGEEEIRNYASLESDLLHPKPDEVKWLAPDPDTANSASGKAALLTQAGYFSVAKLRNQEEMKDFVRRVIDKNCLNIVNEGAFNGLVEWYSGVKDLQDMESLENELFEISSKPDSWLQKRPDASNSCPDKSKEDQNAALSEVQSSQLDSKLSSRQKEYITEHKEGSSKQGQDKAVVDHAWHAGPGRWEKPGISAPSDSARDSTSEDISKEAAIAQVDTLKAEVAALKKIVSEMKPESGKHSKRKAAQSLGFGS